MLVTLWLWEHLLLILLNIKANFLEESENPQAPRDETNVMILSIVCRALGLWTDETHKGKKGGAAVLARGPLLWAVLLGWSKKDRKWGSEAYLLHRVSCTVLGAMSTPSGGGGGV